jgi:hypothetical protein
MFAAYLTAMNTPVLLLVFNRPAHTQAALEHLRQIKPKYLYIHADGARQERPEEQALVAEVRHILTAIDWDCEVKKRYRTQNFGLRDGVFDAIHWFFEEVESGIILEDDCMPDPKFFDFCTELLEKYADNEQIMHIGGSNLIDFKTEQKAESYIFSQHTFVWGWATWRRAWDKMSLDLQGLANYKKSGNITVFLEHPKAQEYMLDKFHVTRERQNQSWAYAWQYSVLYNKGLTIIPTRNLIENTGIGDAQATNTKGMIKGAKIKAKSLDFPLKHPIIARDRALDQDFFFANQKAQHRLWLWWLLKKMDSTK